MLVVLLCCMMKIIEFSAGKPVESVPEKRKFRKRRRLPAKYRGKAMNEVALGGKATAISPDSDCNSNHPGSNSFISNTSSQDIDFIQDNSDYQWFLDFGYRDTNHHTSILSLPESYDANDGYYDALAKNMDANLAEADMESFRTEDIHALLSNLPPMCTDHLSQETNRQGESYASVSGSMMAKFDFDSSMSPHSSSQGEDSANSTSMSICKSELLFSPVKELPMPGANFSVDSLDCDLLTEHDIMLTCQANKDNYTIAFEGSVTMYSEDSDYHDTDKSENTSDACSTNLINNLKTQVAHIKALQRSMTQSDSGSFTTWSKLKKRTNDNQLMRRQHPSGNNNESGDEHSHYLDDNALKSQSMPNLHRQKLRGLIASNYLMRQRNNINSTSSELETVCRRPVKVFDIQHQSTSGSGVSLASEMATSVDAASSISEASNKPQNFSLVKLFMKQKSMSAEGMSTALDQSSLSENWPTESSVNKQTKDRFLDSLLVENKHVLEEKDENASAISESVEQLSESISESLTGTKQTDINKPAAIHGFNVNNNNSIEMKHSIKRIRSRATNTKANFDESDSSSSASSERKDLIRPKLSKNVPVHLMHRSMQTSCLSDITNKPAPYKLNCNNSKSNVKVVEPSFLNKLKREAEIQKPVYVLYPNYVLPDLDFISTQDVAKVLLMPQKPPESSQPKKRPFSCNDVEALKRKDFSHVQDWDSLNFLLPLEYKKILAEVPEVSHHINIHKKDKPSFCATTKLKHRPRPVSCDYTGTFDRHSSLERTNVSSSSSTTTQPSSGYRGSSSMIDSQGSPAQTNYNPLFVYRYDSVTSSEASLINEKQKSITITTAPPLPKRSISLDPYKSDLVPPRPPLPRSILRKGVEKQPLKRYSMLVTKDEINEDAHHQSRRSFQEPIYIPRNKRLSETEDEGVDAGTSSSSLDEQNDFPIRNTSPLQQRDILFANLNKEDLVQLEDFLKISGISSDHDDINEESLLQLRSYVGKFLSLKMNQQLSEQLSEKKVSFAETGKNDETKTIYPPNNSPNVSAIANQRSHQARNLMDMPICEEGETSPEVYSSPQTTPKHKPKYHFDIAQKRLLISAVTEAVETIIHHYSPATNQSELIALGDSSLNPTCAKLALSTLCPALYAVLSDGLKPNLETSFGAIGNSVWQVVEASSQQGPLTKSLNELVMHINGEDAITEGLVKFNAFVFGLLNVRSLDAWASFLRTRETVLRKHYAPDSLLLLSHTGGSNIRALVDMLIDSLQPLALLPFKFDLLFEYRQLHQSFNRINRYQQPTSPTKQKSSSNSETEEVSVATTIRHYSPETDGYKPRPRSCVEPKANFKLGEDVTSMQKKRWSGISHSSKLYQIYHNLAKENSEEEYTDSLETGGNQRVDGMEDLTRAEDLPQDGPESLDSNVDEKPLNGRRFKKLQKKWEMLSGRESQSPPESPTHKSKIPRLIPSPVKPSGIPIPVCASPSSKNLAKGPAKKVTTPPSGAKKAIPGLVMRQPSDKCITITRKAGTTTTRTSRLDQLENSGESRHPTRPSSLPYKPTSAQAGKNSKITPPRRAVSTSVNRKPQNKIPKVVRTLSHRLPSESGHLSYNEGERLKVVLEVDEKWLLCCRGTQKGLVPKSAVIADTIGRF